MKRILLLVFLFFLLLSSFVIYSPKNQNHFYYNNEKLNFPYLSQGLTKRQAAAHLISRFTYGVTPGLIDDVISKGLEKWFMEQLDGNLQDDTLNQMLARFQFLNLTNNEVVKTFPKPQNVLKMAIADGVISNDSLGVMEKQERKSILETYKKEKNLHQQGELVREFINQRILKARYSNNQLHEVLTGFWFNHFNVSLTKPQVVLLAPAYERDVIRPNVTGKFGDLLLATAQSPAMLLYLDNFISMGDNDSLQYPKYYRNLERLTSENNFKNDSLTKARVEKLKKFQKNKGLNENYARELMELHTLGVDGGYTQTDVTQAARVLTGWTVYPFEEMNNAGMKKEIEKMGEGELLDNGFVHDGDFLFAMNRHDVKEKKILGKIFPAKIGYSEGVALLKLLSHHPSTAKFISKKLAKYFVADNPPQSLIDKMAKTFLEKDGDITTVLITMVNAPEFWSGNAVRQKTKSPFELVISATRALNAEIIAPFQLFLRMERMGQKIYYYQAPTGFPDKAEYWINTGSLLNRMNFGIDICANNIRGTYSNLLSINNFHEPQNPNEALTNYATLLMPERDMEATIKRLTPLLTTPDLKEKLEHTDNQNTANSIETNLNSSEAMKTDEEDSMFFSEETEMKSNRPNKEINSHNMLAQVVGIIIGSPEFQRR